MHYRVPLKLDGAMIPRSSRPVMSSGTLVVGSWKGNNHEDAKVTADAVTLLHIINIHQQAEAFMDFS
jgi:hypothetical protein